MTAPDADELAVRARLHKLLDAPDDPAPASDAPAPDADDWWDDLYAGDEPADEPDGEAPDDEDDTPPPTPARTRRASHRPSPRQSLLDAWDGTSPRLRWLIYHGTAAGFGWGLGIVTWSTQVTVWIAADRYADPQSITCYALALAAVALYRRTRHWWWPVAWMTATPICSIVTGVLLYAPNQ
jgi:hypothetical protein